MNTTEDKARYPLEGITVLEYGVFHAGPGAAAILGDLGAEVIKVETAGGDPERYWTHLGKMNMAMPDGQSFMVEVSNRNKKSIRLDIRTEKGRDVFNRLLERSDVFLTNLRKSTKEKLGLDYDSVRRIKPDIIQAGVSGYGRKGPMADLGAFDPLGLARSGMMFITGSEEPRLIHLGVLDQATAIACSHAIITALLVKERQGAGQEVHVSLYSTGLWLTYCNLMLYNGMGLNPTAAGDRSRHSPLRNAFQCKDGRWIIGTHHPEDRYWPTLLKAVGREDLADDPRFVDDDARQANCPELVALFDEIFASRTRDEWMEILMPYGLMYSSVQTLPELQHDPQALANGYFERFDHPKVGEMNIPGYPIFFSRSKAGAHAPAPELGQHTDEVLAWLGLTAAEVEELKEAGVV